MSSAAIYQKYKRSSFTHFVSENRETLNHFPASSITPYSHKSIFDLNGMILDATGIVGGSIVLYPPSDRNEKYFICLSDGSFHLEGNSSCNLYTQSTGDTHRMDGTLARWIDIAKFKKRQQQHQGSSTLSYCMLESSDKMIIRFNAKTRCFLYTSGQIHLDLKLVDSMEFWSRSKVTSFPFSYHIYSIRLERHTDFMSKLHNLPPAPAIDPRVDEYLLQFNDGSLRADVVRNEKTGVINCLTNHMKLKSKNRPIYDQHDSFLFYDHEPGFTFLKDMKIYVKPSRSDDIYPIFSAQGGEVELSVMRERYKVGENEYYVNGLYLPKKKDEIIAYFYLNPTNNHILFILPYASASSTLNTKPIPFEPQYSKPIVYVEEPKIIVSNSSYRSNIRSDQPQVRSKDNRSNRDKITTRRSPPSNNDYRRNNNGRVRS